MKKIFALLLAIVLVSTPVLLKADTDELTGSITCQTEYVSGTTMDLNFTLTWNSPDDEYMHHPVMTFPVGMTPNSASQVGWGNPNISGQEIVWNWTGGGASGTENFTVNVTIDPNLLGNQDADYTVFGDSWGSAPHEFSGIAIIVESPPPPSVPLSNWAFAIIGLLSVTFVYIKFRR